MKERLYVTKTKNPQNRHQNPAEAHHGYLSRVLFFNVLTNFKIFVKLLPMLNFEKIEQLVAQGYISKRAHPSGELFILNYTKTCQFERFWTPETMACRGLIIDKENRIVARPFPKFFNYEELDGKVPAEPFEIYEKLDGSLGILYHFDGKPAIASRGSFDSEQAKWATEIFQKYANYKYFQRDYTYLFEIVAIWNRIVVKYDWEGLVLLAILETSNGKEIDLPKDSWQMQTRFAQYDTREHLHTSLEGLETVQGLSEFEFQKRPSKISGAQKSEYQGMEKKEFKKIERIGDEGLLQSQKLPRSSQRQSLHGLWTEISDLCDGFRPQTGREDSQRGEMQKFEEDNRRDQEMRSSVCQLSQNANLEKDWLQVVKRYQHLENLSVDQLRQFENDKDEGFVIRFRSGMRCKLKFSEYKRLHRIMTGITARRVYETMGIMAMRNSYTPKEMSMALKMNLTEVEQIASVEDPFKEIIDRVPDEFFQWLKATQKKLQEQHDEIEQWAYYHFAGVEEKFQTKKEKVEYFKNECPNDLFGILCAMADGKKIDHHVWKMIRPAHEKPFMVDEEG